MVASSFSPGIRGRIKMYPPITALELRKNTLLQEKEVAEEIVEVEPAEHFGK